MLVHYRGVLASESELNCEELERMYYRANNTGSSLGLEFVPDFSPEI